MNLLALRLLLVRIIPVLSVLQSNGETSCIGKLYVNDWIDTKGQKKNNTISYSVCAFRTESSIASLIHLNFRFRYVTMLSGQQAPAQEKYRQLVCMLYKATIRFQLKLSTERNSRFLCQITKSMLSV